MGNGSSGKPPAPDLPKYLLEPLEKQSPERLETVAAYATDLAGWKRDQREAELEQRRAEEEVDEEAHPPRRTGRLDGPGGLRGRPVERSVHHREDDEGDR